MKTKFEVMLQLTNFNSSCGFKKDCNIKQKNVPKNKAKLFEDNIETDHTNPRPEYSKDSSDQTYYVVVGPKRHVQIYDPITKGLLFNPRQRRHKTC